jgi:tetratricopeptide (TPR) repeat protein
MQVSSAFNLQEEESVARGCLEAWRQGLKDKNDVKAMQMLEELCAKHPGVSSVYFMMGQVEEHFGKHKEATGFYKKAYDINDFSSVQTFKLAESLRKSGDAAGSLVYYQKLLSRLTAARNEHAYTGASVQLISSVRLGLAQSLKDLKRNDEAIAEVKAVIASKPDDKTKVKAGALLKELEREGD